MNSKSHSPWEMQGKGGVIVEFKHLLLRCFSEIGRESTLVHKVGYQPEKGQVEKSRVSSEKYL